MKKEIKDPDQQISVRRTTTLGCMVFEIGQFNVNTIGLEAIQDKYEKWFFQFVCGRTRADTSIWEWEEELK